MKPLNLVSSYLDNIAQTLQNVDMPTPEDWQRVRYDVHLIKESFNNLESALSSISNLEEEVSLLTNDACALYVKLFYLSKNVSDFCKVRPIRKP